MVRIRCAVRGVTEGVFRKGTAPQGGWAVIPSVVVEDGVDEDGEGFGADEVVDSDVGGGVEAVAFECALASRIWDKQN